VTALSDEILDSWGGEVVGYTAEPTKLESLIEELNEESSTEELEIELLKAQLRASEEREAVLRTQLLKALDDRLEKEATASKMPKSPAYQPLRTGVQMTFTLPCGAKAELCMHRDGRWCLYEYHKQTISRQVPVRNVPTEHSTFFIVLGDGVTSVYQTTLGDFEVVIQSSNPGESK
jgi:hypothetical protein